MSFLPGRALDHLRDVSVQRAVFAPYALAAQHAIAVTMRRLALLRLSAVTSGDPEFQAEQRVLFGKMT